MGRPLEEECRNRIDQLYSSMLFTRLIMDPRLFFLLAVALPTLLPLFSNVSLAVLQASSTLPAEPPAVSAAPGENQASGSFVPSPFGHPLYNGPTHESIAWGSYLQPWICQMAIMALQVLIGILLTKEARAYACVNSVIANIEHDLNKSINAKIAAAAGACLEGALSEVTKRCDDFFPKFKSILGRVEQIEEAARRTKQLTGFASKLPW